MEVTMTCKALRATFKNILISKWKGQTQKKP